MGDCFRALTNIAVARSGGQTAFVSTGSTTSAFTGNLSVTGILAGGTVTGQFASQTQAYISTLSAGSASSSFANVGTLASSVLTVTSLTRLDNTILQSFDKSVGTLVNDSANICTVSAANGGFLVELSIVQSVNTWISCKLYQIPLSFNATLGNWYRCLPISQSIFNGSVDVDCQMSGNTCTFRLVRSSAGGATTGFTVSLRVIDSTAANVTIANDTTTTLGSTGSVTNSGVFFGTPFTTSGGRVGINILSPTYGFDANCAGRFSGSLTVDSTGPCIKLTATNPGDMLVKAYTNPMDRYGIGQYTQLPSNAATMRLFTSGNYGTLSSIALSLAGSGSGGDGTFTDVLIVKGMSAAGTLSTAGSVGINISPSYTLDVSGSCRIGSGNTAWYLGTVAGFSGGAFMQNNTMPTNASTSFALYQDNISVTVPNTLINAPSTGNVHLQIANTTKLIVTSAGNVGINTTTPAAAMDVSGSCRVTGSLTVAGNVLASVSNKSYLYNAGIISNAAGTVTDVGAGNVGMIFTNPATLDLVNGNNTSMVRVVGTTVGILNPNPSYTLDINGSARVTNGLIIGTNTDNICLTVDALPGSNPGNRLGFVKQAGNVPKIVAATTTAIIFGISSSADLSQNIATSTVTEGFRLANNGFVGIMNSSPSYPLDVGASARVSGSILTSALSVTNTVDNQTNVTSSVTSGANGYIHPFNIVAPGLSSNEAAILQIGQNLNNNNSMYLGFVYQSPAATSNYATIGFYGNDKILNVTAARNVGINQTSPSYNCDITGSCRVTGMSVFNSYFMCTFN